jgi:hypothetical protein
MLALTLGLEELYQRPKIGQDPYTVSWSRSVFGPWAEARKRCGEWVRAGLWNSRGLWSQKKSWEVHGWGQCFYCLLERKFRGCLCCLLVISFRVLPGFLFLPGDPSRARKGGWEAESNG